MAIAFPVSAGVVTCPQSNAFGIDLSAQDKTVGPGADFWSYANGDWEKRTEIPADRNSVGYLGILRAAADRDVHKILDDMAANPGPGGARGKLIGDFYASWMDIPAVEARGTAPLKPYLGKIVAVNDLTGLQTLFASTGYASPVELGTIPSLSDPEHYTAIAGQGGLGMARDFYLLPGEKYDAFRKAYRAYIQQMQELAGIPEASAKADAIFALETAMAKEQWSPEQSRDIAKLNDPEDITGLKAKAPDFDWALMLKTAGLDSSPKVLMANNTALTAMGKIMTTTPLQTWKDYLAFHFVSDHATFLPKAFDDARFDFYSKALNGVPLQRERWRRGVQATNDALGEAVAAFYVDRYFPESSRAKMAELIENLQEAYRERISRSTWMDATTKKGALAKLAAFKPAIGHPDRYIDYSSLSIDRNDLFGNAIRAAEFQHQLEKRRFTKPVDPGLWSILPQTVNAYYDPLANRITFPAALLQPPCFDPGADPAINYGAIGTIIGHIMSYGFDDQGGWFGPTGQRRNWWTDATMRDFATRTAPLIEQYGAYQPLSGVWINGRLTLGENIADLGGVETAYVAYQKYQAEHGKAPVIAGLTGDQRFFLAYAQVWQAKDSGARQRLAPLTDPHAPAKYRVNGVVRNVDAWYAAFGIKPGDALYLAPEKRVHIW